MKKPKNIMATVKGMKPNTQQRRQATPMSTKKTPFMKSAGGGKKPKGC